MAAAPRSGSEPFHENVDPAVVLDGGSSGGAFDEFVIRELEELKQRLLLAHHGGLHLEARGGSKEREGSKERGGFKGGSQHLPPQGHVYPDKDDHLRQAGQSQVQVSAPQSKPQEMFILHPPADPTSSVETVPQSQEAFKRVLSFSDDEVPDVPVLVPDTPHKQLNEAEEDDLNLADELSADDSVTSKNAGYFCDTSLLALSRNQKLGTKGKRGEHLLNEPLQPHACWKKFDEQDAKDKIKRFRKHIKKASTVKTSAFASKGRTRSGLGGLLGPLAVGQRLQAWVGPDAADGSASGAFRSSQGEYSKPMLTRGQACCGRRVQVMDPNCTFRVCWDLAGVLFIMYDMISIPLLVYDVEQTGPWQILLVMSLLFWATDIPLNFFVGFHVGSGGIELDMRRIMWRYLRTWFLFDIFIVSFDCFLLVEQSQESPTGILRTLRTFRVMRSIRVMRMAKLPHILNKLQENIQSEHVVAFLGISELLVMIIMANHVVSCCWYGLSRWRMHDEDSWVYKADLVGKPKIYLYLTSLHWSFTQFTPASMEVTPNNAIERAYNVVVIIFAMVIFSSFVSRITNTMSHLRSINIENTKQYMKLQNFLRRHHISVALNIRVRACLDMYIAEKRRNIKESDVQLIAQLSEPLRVDLHYEMYSPLMRCHPFFRSYDSDFKLSMYRICHKASAFISASTGDVLFTRGDVSSTMYFLQQGELNYLYKRDAGGAGSQLPVVVSRGTWLAEASLWAHVWVHHGEASAATDCNLMTVDVAQFQHAISENKVATEAPAHYAGIFIDHLNNNISLAELSDLPQESLDLETAVKIAWHDDHEE